MGRVLRGGRETGHTEYTESMSVREDTLEEREDGEDILEERENMLQDSTLTEGNMLQDTILNMLQDSTQMEANMPRDTILTMLRVSTQTVANMLQDTTQIMLQDTILTTPQDSILTEGIMQRDSTRRRRTGWQLLRIEKTKVHGDAACWEIKYFILRNAKLIECNNCIFELEQFLIIFFGGPVTPLFLAPVVGLGERSLGNHRSPKTLPNLKYPPNFKKQVL